MTSEPWRKLGPSEPIKSSALQYVAFKTENGSAANLLVIPSGAKGVRLRPIANTVGAPTSSVLIANPAVLAAVNGGYFNLSNGLSTSYATIGGVVVCDPRDNPALMRNQKLQPFMPAILDRTELRIFSKFDGAQEYRLVNHNVPVSKQYGTFDALQGGPRLLPRITEKEEAFVRTESDGAVVDSIGARKTAARTALGLGKDGTVYILCVASNRQDEFSAGVTLEQVAKIFRQLNCEEAINFDGGTSTTMIVREADGNFRMLCGRNPETRVKTVLAVEEK